MHNFEEEVIVVKICFLYRGLGHQSPPSSLDGHRFAIWAYILPCVADVLHAVQALHELDTVLVDLMGLPHGGLLEQVHVLVIRQACNILFAHQSQHEVEDGQLWQLRTFGLGQLLERSELKTMGGLRSLGAAVQTLPQSESCDEELLDGLTLPVQHRQRLMMRGEGLLVISQIVTEGLMKHHALQTVHDLWHLAELEDQAMSFGAPATPQGGLAVGLCEDAHRFAIILVLLDDGSDNAEAFNLENFEVTTQDGLLDAGDGLPSTDLLPLHPMLAQVVLVPLESNPKHLQLLLIQDGGLPRQLFAVRAVASPCPGNVTFPLLPKMLKHVHGHLRNLSYRFEDRLRWLGHRNLGSFWDAATRDLQCLKLGEEVLATFSILILFDYLPEKVLKTVVGAPRCQAGRRFGLRLRLGRRDPFGLPLATSRPLRRQILGRAVQPLFSTRRYCWLGPLGRRSGSHVGPWRRNRFRPESDVAVRP
mmetsp:Transcript_125193/g.297077  ORF Transcript_125193/g.297077 Transcript_125193/m.297077 type:complete len:476 (-) Transcript_125193:729-2156(-)